MVSASKEEDDICVFFGGDTPREVTSSPVEGINENLASLLIMASHLAAEVDTEVRQAAEVGLWVFLSELTDLVALVLARDGGQILTAGQAH